MSRHPGRTPPDAVPAATGEDAGGTTRAVSARGTGAVTTGASRRARPRSTVVLTYGGLLVAAVVAFASHEWGATVHSLVSIAVIAVVAWHVVSQRRWVTSAARRRLAHPERVLVLYNTALAGVFVVVNVSGFPVWFFGVGGLVLAVHQVTGIAFVFLVLGHLALNRSRLLARLRPRRRVTVTATR